MKIDRRKQILINAMEDAAKGQIAAQESQEDRIDIICRVNRELERNSLLYAVRFLCFSGAAYLFISGAVKLVEIFR